jgi:hypothetical protein
MGFELAGLSWSEFAAGTTPGGPSAFVPLRNTYLNIHESIRGQGEARKIPLLNASLAGPGLKVHPPPQVLEARVKTEGFANRVGLHKVWCQPKADIQRTY